MIEKILGLKHFTGWHMLGVLVLFFGTIIGVNLTLAWFANSSWTGLVVQNSYVESQRFNEVTAEKRRQLALGWQAEIAYGGDTFTVEMTDKDGAPLRGAIVSAKIGHPVQDRNDQTVSLLDRGGGEYAADVALDPGIWNVDLTVTGAKGEIWTRAIRFLVRE
ncbi:FixH family protein [Oricola thermophila]|uniref:FixH family protein n=1 Tax=Oricola thermophila TaxID=2742145 RepID=A0A6N1VEB4_9HYPH|nr:FixH family protein [Oricola thermophila]QKV17499.1 FixH family protein [Oricola thermophila]